MRIVITGWALDSYLELLHGGVIDRDLYRETLRPDCQRLRNLQTDPKFKDPHFWGPAIDRQQKKIASGFKMKWHNIGNGSVQLRLCVALVGGDAYLCHAYVKTSPQQDRRKAALLKNRVQLIQQGTYDLRGELP